MAEQSLTVVATMGGATGTAAGVVSTSRVEPGLVAELVRRAEQAAIDAGPAEDAAPLARDLGVSADWADTSPTTSAATFAALAPALGQSFQQARADDVELFGFAEHTLATTYLGTSTGARLRHVQPTGKIEITGKSHGRERSTWVGQATKDFADVSVPDLHAEIGRRLGWGERRIDLPAGRYDTILPPGAVADLMIYLYWSAAARDAADGRTVFSAPGGGTRVGETLAERALALTSDPAYPGLESRPFAADIYSSATSSVFDAGQPLAATQWIHDGRLAALVQTRHSAAMTGMPFTPAVDNLVLTDRAGSGSVDEVVARTERGLLLTCLWYIREVDPQTLLLTGLTRDGVHLVEGGEVVGTVNNFRFNESPVGMLSRVRDAGATEGCLPREWSDWFTRTAMPALVVEGFNMSSVSQAS